ncbi:hypothetical protein [Candidatus Nanohalococcus occultus]|uniref:hypothetical protein n=1 Tax=Candidatus Nanohalococcus occultus TaxID=2978047 RepID=UPI0039DF9002
MLDVAVTSIFGTVILTAVLVSLAELLGKLYTTFDSLVREDLSSEQKIIYLVLIWLIPLGWAIYLILGREKTAELFEEMRFI